MAGEPWVTRTSSPAPAPISSAATRTSSAGLLFPVQGLDEQQPLGVDGLSFFLVDQTLPITLAINMIIHLSARTLPGVSVFPRPRELGLLQPLGLGHGLQAGLDCGYVPEYADHGQVLGAVALEVEDPHVEAVFSATSAAAIISTSLPWTSPTAVGVHVRQLALGRPSHAGGQHLNHPRRGMGDELDVQSHGSILSRAIIRPGGNAGAGPPGSAPGPTWPLPWG